MRLFAPALAALALSLVSSLVSSLAAPAAYAAPVTVRAVAIDPELQKKFEDNYGTREITVLQDAIAGALTRELAAEGATLDPNGTLIVEATLVDAKPSRPTMYQTIQRPGLDPARSISLGGARLHARILRADGSALGEVDHDWYETDLTNSVANTTWGDARRAIRRFADKVGDAYRASGG